MHRTPFMTVRIFRAAALALAAASITTMLGLAASTPAAAPASPEAPAPSEHHHGAPESAPPVSPNPTLPPSRSAAITTPSWFAGGDSLYVPPYFDSFKGLDLSTLTASQKERFLHQVNTELCTCNQTGCRRDTLAHCYVTDLTCPRAPVRIRELLEQVKGSAKEGSDRAPSPAIIITPKP
jgi:hypothetical protein